MWGSWYDWSCSLVSFINLCSLVFSTSIFTIVKSSLWLFLWRICSVFLYLFRLALFDVYFLRYQNGYTIFNLRFIYLEYILPPFSLRGYMSLIIQGGSLIKQKDESCLYIYSVILFICDSRLLMWRNINAVFADSHYFVAIIVVIVIRLLLFLLWW